jgi:hypothetical protein
MIKIFKDFLPKYMFFKKKHESIAILGTRRGGTTFLTQLLTNHTVRFIDQPFECYYRESYRRIQNFKRSKLPSRNLNQFFYIKSSEKIRMLEYLKEYEDGKNSFIDSNFGFLKKSIVYKFTEGNYFIENFESLNIKPIIIFRHPISQARSCIRNKWGHIYYPYMDSIYFRSKYLDDEKYKLFMEIDLNGTELEKGVLDWFCSNAYLLKCWKEYPTIFYENLIINPIITSEKLKDTWGIKINLNKINDASGSSVFSENNFKENIKSEDFKKTHLKNAFKNIKEIDRINLNRIFKILGINIYASDTYKPTINSELVYKYSHD